MAQNKAQSKKINKISKKKSIKKSKRKIKQKNIKKGGQYEKNNSKKSVKKSVTKNYETLLNKFNNILLRPHTKDELYNVMEELEDLREMNLNDNNDELSNSLFPSIYDPSFSAKIYELNKFNFFKTDEKHIINKSRELIEKYNTGQSDNDKKNNSTYDKFKTFHSSPSQNILKNFISPYSPYRSILIIHGTGVGKTCTAITIAENLKEIIKENNKKIYIIRHQEFQGQLFEINKIKKNKSDMQCTKNTYVDMLEQSLLNSCKNGNIDDCKLAQSRVKRILDTYYTFEGVEKWTKSVYNKIYSNNDKLSEEEQHIYKIRKIRDLFNNSVLIIDEAHHINSETPDSKLVSTVLNDVLLYSENLRLILLTATPMFDKPQDIQSLINYMLINDKRSPIREDMFDSDGMFILDKKQLFIKKTRGYISYLRGNNPFSFPIRLPSSVNLHKSELFNINKYPKIPDKFSHINHKMSFLELVNCQMSNEQKKVYQRIINSQTSTAWSDESQVSNFIYSTFDDLGSDDFSPDLCYGKKGFNLIMKPKKSNKESYSFKDEEIGKRFLPENIKKYSSKVYKIIKILENSNKNGPAFIYTGFIDSGIKPLMIALEMAGYTPYRTPEFVKNKYKINDPSKGQYIIKTGLSEDLNFKTRIIDDYINKRHSMVDSKVRVFIGSEAASEGLSLFGYRESHILDPHFNLSRLEQSIGRTIRNESHTMLPYNKRNVSVYFYAATIGNIESVDLYKYRKAEMKAISSGIVEKISKENSIDCFLNINNNIYTKKHFDKDVNLITSFGKNIKYSLTDQPYSRICHYMSDCGYKCISDRKPIIDKDSGDLKYHDIYPIVEEIVIEIYKLLIEYKIINIDDIYKYLDYDKDKYEEFVNIAIQIILDENQRKDKKIYDKFGTKGKIVFMGEQLKFVDEYIDKFADSNKLLLKYPRYNKTIDLKNYITELKKRNRTQKQLDKLENISSNYEMIINEMISNLNIYKNDKIGRFTNINLEGEDDLLVYLLFNNEILNNRHIIINNILHKYIKHGNKLFNDIESKLFKYFKNNNLLIKYNELLVDDSEVVDKVIGYLNADNKGLKIYIYNEKTGNFDLDEGNQKKILEKKKRKYDIFAKKKPTLETHAIMFPKFNDKQPEFKVSDPSSFKRAKNVYGGNCLHKKKDEIIEIIKIVLNMDKSSNKLNFNIINLVGEKSRQIICNDLKIILASKNLNSNNNTFYLSPEDYYLKIYK